MVVGAVCMCGFALSRRFQYVVVRIFEGSNILPTLHFPRTDAAECDTHFYVLSTSGIFLDTVCGDNGTDYTVGDDLYNWYFIIHRTIIVHDESVVVRWSF